MNISFKIAILFSCASLFACRKTIDVDLNSSSPKLVIEGIVSDSTSIHVVKLSKTNNFSESNTFPTVSGALVILSDNVGSRDTLVETTAGTYMSSKILGKSGVTYSLYVNVEGKTYTSQSTMPNLVQFEKIGVVNTSFFGDKSYYPEIEYVDPVGEQNNYRFLSYVVYGADTVRTDGYSVIDDRNSNGNPAKRTLFVNTEIKPEIGDSFKVTMICNDRPIYTYFYSLSQSQGGDSGAPDNPVTNINGGALGYFSAQTEQTKIIKIE